MTSTARTRLVTAGFAALSLATLAGCATTTGTGTGTGTTIDDTTSDQTTSGSSTTDSSTTYADGTYTADGSYQAPSGTETITVELTIADGTVTAVDVTQDASDPQAQQFQSRFASGISAEVVGKDLSTLSVSRVSGSSLTSTGFNAAVDAIRSQAA